MRNSPRFRVLPGTFRTAGAVFGAAAFILVASTAQRAFAHPDTPPSAPPAASDEAPPAEPTQTKVSVRRAAPRVALDRIADWDTFYREFRGAVVRRDRAALKGCMVTNFLFTLDPVSDTDRREAAFREWDRPDTRGWEQIERVLSRGSRWDPLVPTLKIAPPEWATNPHYVDYRVGFERQGGVWRWVWTMRGE